MSPRSALALLLASTVLAVPAAAQVDPLAKPLPLGPKGLSEKRVTLQVAPGVRLVTITRGRIDPADAYTVQVSTRAAKQQAEQDRATLMTLGMAPELLALTRAQDDHRAGPSAWVVRDGGRYSQSAEATARAGVLVALGFSQAKAVHTSEDGVTAGRVATGPWVVQVLEVDPRRVGVVAALSNDTYDGTEVTSAMVTRLKGLAGVNGDFFVTAATGGTVGDVAGLSVLGGRLGSESAGPQAALLLRREGLDVGVARSAVSVRSSDGATALVRGLNRVTGLISGCGGSPGSQPTSRPRRDATCTDANDLVRYDARFSASGTPSGDGGVEAVVDGRGVVQSLRSPRGGSIPDGGRVYAGTGTAGTWLTAHAKPGMRLSSKDSLTVDRAGAAMPSAVVAGGPLLVSQGRRDVRAVEGGFSYDENLEFFHRFGLRRNNRTLAGLRRDGTLLLITVDGRTPATSIGLTFDESAALLLWAGALEGLNLDGGGSTTMVTGDGRGGATVRNRPTDATGERAVGDALVVVRR
jgi:exopolysaccharide biosynthesis protein